MLNISKYFFLLSAFNVPDNLVVTLIEEKHE
jgi:hypothetical protein